MIVSVSSILHVTDGNGANANSNADANGYGSLQYSLTDQMEMILGIQACRDASIALSEIPGILAHHTYELVIGAGDNTQTILKRGVRGTTVFTSITPGILDCQHSLIFWTTWNSNSISFGKGSVVGQNRVLYYRDNSFPQISALSVMTPPTVRGVWGFYTFTGKGLHTRSLYL